MRHSLIDPLVTKQRRAKLASLMEEGSALLLSATNESRRNGGYHMYPYRQDSSLYFLTGFEEPKSFFLFIPGEKVESILFVQKKDPVRETWDGFLFGVEGAKEVFGVDEVHLIEDFQKIATEKLTNKKKLYYQLQSADQSVFPLLDVLKFRSGRHKAGYADVEDSRELLQKLRMVKDEFEVKTMKASAEIAAKAHIEVMRAAAPGVNERALHGVFLQQIMRYGAKTEAYNGIFAGGDNATCLHYTFNDQVLKDNQLLLVDAGAEFEYYASDITRTFPVGGQFTPLQKELYARVLETQKELVNSVKPGVSFLSIGRKAVSLLSDHLLEMGILSGTKDEVIEKKHYAKYYPHSVGHWLGLDVHDLGSYKVNEKEERVFEKNMCLTIEPGLYIPKDDESVEEGLRGVGIRIEDDILVSEEGCVVMSATAPKEIDELENLVGQNKEFLLG